jgi:hypothetical protein
MGFHDDLARIVADPEVRRLAERRAGCRELAEDALHETYWAVARTKSPSDIRDLRAFFCTSLIREINHQRTRQAPVPTQDIEGLSDRRQVAAPHAAGPPPTSVEGQASLRMLAQVVLARLKAAPEGLTVLIPARSDDANRYRDAIIGAAITILNLLLEGYVVQADWNAVLRAAYPQWCDEPGLARDASDKRLSRARHDVQDLLRALFPPRDELAS